MSADTRHGVRSGTKATKITKTTTCFVFFVFFVTLVPERVAVARLSGQQGQAITSTATAILVDAVVRDKNGKLLTDLAAADFEVFEDGSRQTIDSFTRVSHGGGIGVGVAWRVPDRTVAINPTARHEAPAAAIPNQDAATVALVYDHLSS